jgi:hypothetical protein
VKRLELSGKGMKPAMFTAIMPNSFGTVCAGTEGHPSYRVSQAKARNSPPRPVHDLAVEMPGRTRENGHHNRETGKYQQETDGQGPSDY